MIQKRCLTVLTCFHLHRSVALNSIDKTIFYLPEMRVCSRTRLNKARMCGNFCLISAIFHCFNQ